MMQISETEAFRACRILFGSDLRLNRDFLQYLQPSGARSAFRQKAKTTHPDSSPNDHLLRHSKVRLFQDLNQAHQLLQKYLRQRDLLSARGRGSRTTRSHSPGGTHPRDTATRQATQGPLPTRPLPFGLYLYYRGLIPYSALIGALTWQRQQRPIFGQIAQRWGWLDSEGISRILSCRKIGRFGDRAEYLGLLSPIQVRAILLHQRTRQGKLGSYFVEQGLLSQMEVNRLLADLAEHNQKYRHGYPNHFYYHHR